MARTIGAPVYLTATQLSGPDRRVLTPSSPGGTDSVESKLPFAAGGDRQSYVRPEQAVNGVNQTGPILPVGSAFGWGWALSPTVAGIVIAGGNGYRLLPGNFVTTLHYSRDGGLLTSNPQNVTVTTIFFRVTEALAVVSELCRGSVTGLTFTTTEQTTTITSALASSVSFDPTDLIYMEMHVNRVGGGADQGSHIRTNSASATRLTTLPQYERTYARALGDAPPVADAVTRLFSGARSLSDAAPAVDALARQVASNRSLADAIVVSDSLARAFTGSRALSDTAPIADEVERAATYARDLADSIPLADAVTRVVSAARSLADSAPPVADVLERQFTGARSLNDAAPIFDAVQRAFTGSRSLVDSLPLVDAVTRQVNAARALADSAPPVADVIDRAAIFSRDLADAAPPVVDDLERLFTGARQLNDAAPVADTLQRAATFARDLDDDLTNGAAPPPTPVIVRNTILIFDD